ncbi:MAG TPA: cytochrome c oxidase assembly protein [Stenomitos sp.]
MTPDDARQQEILKKNQRTLMWLGLVLVFMTFFAWGLVPFYRMVCQKFGVGTIPQKPDPTQVSKGVGSRVVTVRFVGMTNVGTAARIEPLVQKVDVKVGQTTEVDYRFTNLSDHVLVFQPVHSVVPARADAMLHKLQCFCYQQQTLKPKESKVLPLSFWMDDKLDPEINTVTLQYTLYALHPERPVAHKS